MPDVGDLGLANCPSGPHWMRASFLFVESVCVVVRAQDNNSPLHLAVRTGGLAAIQKLLSFGADPNAANDVRVQACSVRVSFRSVQRHGDCQSETLLLLTFEPLILVAPIRAIDTISSKRKVTRQPVWPLSSHRPRQRSHMLDLEAMGSRETGDDVSTRQHPMKDSIFTLLRIKPLLAQA